MSRPGRRVYLEVLGGRLLPLVLETPVPPAAPVRRFAPLGPESPARRWIPVVLRRQEGPRDHARRAVPDRQLLPSALEYLHRPRSPAVRPHPVGPEDRGRRVAPAAHVRPFPLLDLGCLVRPLDPAGQLHRVGPKVRVPRVVQALRDRLYPPSAPRCPSATENQVRPMLLPAFGLGILPFAPELEVAPQYPALLARPGKVLDAGSK